jgi:hypothetical protein
MRHDHHRVCLYNRAKLKMFRRLYNKADLRTLSWKIITLYAKNTRPRNALDTKVRSVAITLGMQIYTLRTSPLMHRTLVTQRTHILLDVRYKTPWTTHNDR